MKPNVTKKIKITNQATLSLFIVDLRTGVKPFRERFDWRMRTIGDSLEDGSPKKKAKPKLLKIKKFIKEYRNA